jgi:hypothetical protein
VTVTWRRSDGALWRFGVHYVALATIDGETFEAEGPGADIWAVLTVPSSVASIANSMAATYAGDPDAIAADVARFLGELEQRGLVERDS